MYYRNKQFHNTISVYVEYYEYLVEIAKVSLVYKYRRQANRIRYEVLGNEIRIYIPESLNINIPNELQSDTKRIKIKDYEQYDNFIDYIVGKAMDKFTDKYIRTIIN